MIYQLIIFIVFSVINTWKILKNAFICLRKLIWIQYFSFTAKYFNTLKIFNLITNIWFFKNVIEFTTVSFPSVFWNRLSKFRYSKTEILNSKKHRELNKIVFNKIVKIIIRIRYTKNSRVRDYHNYIYRSRHRLFSKC